MGSSNTKTWEQGLFDFSCLQIIIPQSDDDPWKKRCNQKPAKWTEAKKPRRTEPCAGPKTKTNKKVLHAAHCQPLTPAKSTAPRRGAEAKASSIPAGSRGWHRRLRQLIIVQWWRPKIGPITCRKTDWWNIVWMTLPHSKRRHNRACVIQHSLQLSENVHG